MSIDSRITRYNPLYKAWKTKSFTDGDIASQVDKYLSAFDQARVFDLTNVVNQLLKLKMKSPEVKMIPGIPEINEYLDESISSVKSAVRLLDDSRTPDWNELNQLFLKELMN